ncbi:MAG: hypothetical protein D6784_06885 [Chloroflexi bacterium]|nr:MAG: hypothetical protein D6784_06885 [Chloroflexota bacterium]
MPVIEEVIEIAAPRADVFRFCHNVDRWSEWQEQVEGAELLGSNMVRSGALLRIDARVGHGAVFSWDAEFVGYQMPTGSRLRVLDTAPSSPFAKGSELSWELESVGSGTRFTWRWSYQPQGILRRITDRLGGRGAVQRAIQRSLVNLKEIMESGRHIG